MIETTVEIALILLVGLVAGLTVRLVQRERMWRDFGLDQPEPEPTRSWGPPITAAEFDWPSVAGRSTATQPPARPTSPPPPPPAPVLSHSAQLHPVPARPAPGRHALEDRNAESTVIPLDRIREALAAERRTVAQGTAAQRIVSSAITPTP